MAVAASSYLAVSSSTAAKVEWSQAALLTVALVAFGWVSDLQGVLRYRDSLDAADWLRSGVAYAAFAGLVLWRWDWVMRVALSPQFAVTLALGAAAMWGANANGPSSPVSSSAQSAVPALRSDARKSRPVVGAAVAPAAAVNWTLPVEPSGRSLKAWLEERMARGADSADQQDQGGPMFDYTLPKGWTVQPAAAMRVVNLRVAGDPGAECYLAQLGGDGGGLLANVNRWRTQQMGLTAIDDAALAKLPRTKLFGRDAVLVELDGTFTDSMSGRSVPEARMVGAIVTLPMATLFVKMTGPRELITRERPGFDQFVASLALKGAGPKRDDAAPKPGANAAKPPAANPPAASAGASGLRWTAPAEWTLGPAREMREATFVPKAAADTECVVSVLAGDAGGLVRNVNRWRELQFGMAALDAEGVAKLPKLKVLGREATIVEARGSFTGMDGKRHDDYGLLGLVCPQDGRVLFVKMVGPASQVESERERFMSFCKSLGGD